MKFRLSGKIAKLVSFCAISSLVCGAAVNPQDYLTANGTVNKAAVSYALKRGASAADIAAALAKKTPARAKEIAALLASMAPKEAAQIAAAVAWIAPIQAADIAAAVTAKVPAQARRISRQVSRAVPTQRTQIREAVKKAVPQVSVTTPTPTTVAVRTAVAQQVEADVQDSADDVTTSNLTTETKAADPVSAP
jgi:hypothetical protein